MEESRAAAGAHKLRRRGSVPHLWSEASIESASAEAPSRIHTPPEELLAPEAANLAYGAPPPVPPKPYRNSENFYTSSRRQVSTTSRETKTTTKKTCRNEAYFNCKFLGQHKALSLRDLL